MKNILSIFITLTCISLFAQTQVGQDIAGDSNSDSFGNSVDISSDGSIVIIGSSSSGSTGMVSNGLVRAYEFDGSQWVQLGNDIYGDANEAGFGSAVALSAGGYR